MTEVFKDNLQKYRMLATKVLDKLFMLACRGDTSAANLYLKAIGGLPGLEKEVAIKNQQNNFIQINRMVITEEEFRQLPSDVLNNVQAILKQHIPIDKSS
jgi:hypothetical protein